ncbi:hypothetical protein ADK49_13065 [Streptomyces sp. WM6349]|uniref:Uncharacterized protein n=1 Tax=Streptomyces antibioticus TaxID=1890 RepID=A0ABX3LPG9_STRAT|nr:hypothetical protein ADK49_13065 [Streptomyces sp. WM6349]KOV50518.1 hypothetical protein ADK98_08475 [Streptomyces sp. H036]OOQ54058.1 hypothetical protein AFM16_05560 [Streptomyces antibioticus]
MSYRFLQPGSEELTRSGETACAEPVPGIGGRSPFQLAPHVPSGKPAGVHGGPRRRAPTRGTGGRVAAPQAGPACRHAPGPPPPGVPLSEGIDQVRTDDHTPSTDGIEPSSPGSIQSWNGASTARTRKATPHDTAEEDVRDHSFSTKITKASPAIAATFITPSGTKTTISPALASSL